MDRDLGYLLRRYGLISHHHSLLNQARAQTALTGIDRVPEKEPENKPNKKLLLL